MKTEKFADGSTIDTDETTGNLTVCGKLAHDAYFARLREERITRQTPFAVMAYCRDVDGTRKVELIRRITQPLLVETFGPYSYEVWTASDPGNVTRVASLERGMELFKQFALHGTNGFSANS